MERKLLTALSWAGVLWLAGLILYPARSVLNPWGPKRYFPPGFMHFYFAGKLAAEGRTAEIHHPPAYEAMLREMQAQWERNDPAKREESLARRRYPEFAQAGSVQLRTAPGQVFLFQEIQAAEVRKCFRSQATRRRGGHSKPPAPITAASNNASG